MVGGTEARHGRRGRTHRRAGRLAIMIVGRSLSISQRDLARVPANLTITDLMTGEDAANSSDLDPRSFKLVQTLPLEASPWESMKAHLIAPAQKTTEIKWMSLSVARACAGVSPHPKSNWFLPPF